jgi:hypothetical protein
MGHGETAKGAGIAPGEVLVAVAHEATETGADTGVLDGTVFEEKKCPDHANTRPQNLADHLRQPTRAHDFCVVVEEHQDLAGGGFNSHIHHGREIEGASIFEHYGVGALPQAIDYPESLALTGLVVYHDQLDVRIFAEGVDAPDTAI